MTAEQQHQAASPANLDASLSGNTSSVFSRNPEWSAHVEKITAFSTMLKAIHLGKKKDQQFACMTIQNQGMQVETSKAKSMIARCTLPDGYFREWNLTTQGFALYIDISTLIQVLTIFDADCNHYLEHYKETDKLRLFLTDGNRDCLTEATLKTFDHGVVEIPDLNFNAYRVSNYLSVKPTFFKDIFNEIDSLAKDEDIVWFEINKGNNMNGIGLAVDTMNLDQKQEEKQELEHVQNNKRKKTGTDEEKLASLTIGVVCDALQFEATVPLVTGSDAVCISHDFRDQCKRYQYRMSLLRPALRAITKSVTMRIDFNEQNTVRIQHLFTSIDQNNFGWVEFIILHQELDFDNDDDSD